MTREQMLLAKVVDAVRRLARLQHRAHPDTSITTFVAIGEGRQLDASDCEAKVIYTADVCGSQATAMLVQMIDGTRSVFLQKYLPTQELEHGKELRTFLSGIDPLKTTEATLVIILPGTRNSGGSSLEADNPLCVDYLSLCARARLPRTSVVIKPYSKRQHNDDGRRQFSIHLSSDGSSWYHTWFGNGVALTGRF